MSSKHWIERAIRGPETARKQVQSGGGNGAGLPGSAKNLTDKRARLAEMLLKMRKEKG